MLSKIFEVIKQQNAKYASALTGNDFENNFEQLMKSFQMTQLYNDQAAKLQGHKSFEAQIASLLNMNIKSIQIQWASLKAKILDKNSIEPIMNPWPSLANYFIKQPHGTQNYPDFLLFTRDYIVPVEIKYSKKKDKQKKTKHEALTPMWNSNLPKANGIYIFGVSGIRVTFFRGCDVLDANTRIKLNQFFSDLGTDEEIDEKIKTLMSGLANPFGFKPYIRKAFDHDLKSSTLFNDENKQYIESYFSANSNDRELEVIKFLQKIE